MGDLDKLTNATPFDQFRDGLAEIKTEIEFITESVNDLEGLEYANALATISDLERQDYEMRLQYLAQLKALQENLITSISDQVEGFRWDAMSEEERYAYAESMRSQSWADVFSARSEADIADAVEQYLSWTGQQWNLGKSLYGEDWTEQNLNAFETDADALNKYISETLQTSIDELVKGQEDLSGQVSDTVGSFSALNDELPALSENLSNVTLEVAALATAMREATAALQNAAGQLAWTPEVNG